jgi:hypothetical protein
MSVAPPSIDLPPGFTLISTERLQKLEAMETKRKANLEKLLQAKKDSPVPIHVQGTSTKRVLRHIEKNREAYNARRRELRRLKKESASIPPTGE